MNGDHYELPPYEPTLLDKVNYLQVRRWEYTKRLQKIWGDLNNYRGNSEQRHTLLHLMRTNVAMVRSFGEELEHLRVSSI